MFVDPEGPVVVEGPVEIVLADGTVARSDRFSVAVCTCRRSRTYPWCDTSHRRRERADRPRKRSATENGGGTEKGSGTEQGSRAGERKQ
ncbi:CDGSH iron-sulfur domain-containing protein [Streptomyces sp. NPDC014861]|uniref:CDGSH iron-sulfur domain-containing protein n=1 Tax=Streptomyces sp. NPDC014861 TaxID=3364923 RepID=UPI0036F90B52